MPQHLDGHTLELARAYASTQERMKELGEVAEHLKGQLIAALGEHDTGVDSQGSTVLTYRASRRFDVDKAAELLNDSQRRECSTLSASKVKAVLGDHADAFMVSGVGPRRLVVKV